MDYFKYFGSPIKAKPEMLEDLRGFLVIGTEYTLKKEILFAAENIDVKDILRIEQEMIQSHSAKNPAVGYNR